MRPLPALVQRSQSFALRVIEFVDECPQDRISAHLAHQLLKSGTSVGANYRSSCRARSNAELYSKLCICEEEADECVYWFNLFETARGGGATMDAIQKEANQLVAIFATAKRTLRAMKSPPGSKA